MLCACGKLKSSAFNEWLSIQQGHERRLSLANKQEQAIKSLKVYRRVDCEHFRVNRRHSIPQDKLLNRLASGAEQTGGERIIKEHQINKEVLEETIQK